VKVTGADAGRSIGATKSESRLKISSPSREIASVVVANSTI